MTLNDFLELWPVVPFFVGIIAWALRLESMSRMNKQSIEYLSDRIDRQENDIKERLGKIDARLELIASSLEKVIWRFARSDTDKDQ